MIIKYTRQREPDATFESLIWHFHMLCREVASGSSSLEHHVLIRAKQIKDFPCCTIAAEKHCQAFGFCPTAWNLGLVLQWCETKAIMTYNLVQTEPAGGSSSHMSRCGHSQAVCCFRKLCLWYLRSYPEDIIWFWAWLDYCLWMIDQTWTKTFSMIRDISWIRGSLAEAVLNFVKN